MIPGSENPADLLTKPLLDQDAVSKLTHPFPGRRRSCQTLISDHPSRTPYIASPPPPTPRGHRASATLSSSSPPPPTASHCTTTTFPNSLQLLSSSVVPYVPAYYQAHLARGSEGFGSLTPRRSYGNCDETGTTRTATSFTGLYQVPGSWSLRSRQRAFSFGLSIHLRADASPALSHHSNRDWTLTVDSLMLLRYTGRDHKPFRTSSGRNAAKYCWNIGLRGPWSSSANWNRRVLTITA